MGWWEGGRGDAIKCNEYLQCDRYWDKLFTYVNSFIKTTDEETGSESLSNITKITQLGSSREVKT